MRKNCLNSFSPSGMLRNAQKEVAEKVKKLSVFMLSADIHKSSSFYNTNNMYIYGDSLESLKLLRNGYIGRVKMICAGMPHNEYRPTADSNHILNDWQKMIYAHFLVSVELLSDDGVIFIKVDNDDLLDLRAISDDVFGKKNFVTQVLCEKATKEFSGSYAVCYTKNISMFHVHNAVKQPNFEYSSFDRSAKAAVKKLFKYKTANCPQPEDVIRFFINAVGASSDDVILDYLLNPYATACSVMRQNACDGKTRRFIIIQTPENTEISGSAYMAGYKDVCDIETEQIKRSAESIAQSDAPYAKEIDNGYKFFRIVPPSVMPI